MNPTIDSRAPKINPNPTDKRTLYLPEFVPRSKKKSVLISLRPKSHQSPKLKTLLMIVILSETRRN
jgi:hypothetical protein